jgi:hypothetical protein
MVSKMGKLTKEQQKKVEEMIMQQAVEGRIACAKARGIAKTLGLPIKTVGSIADDLHIKISQCELGCF